jgi:hypothetical protein
VIILAEASSIGKLFILNGFMEAFPSFGHGKKKAGNKPASHYPIEITDLPFLP